MLLIKKVFDDIVWVMFFGLLLLGGIIFVSNRTYPGDKLYPFKLKFESFALATSKVLNKQVDFSIDLVIKRSSEVAKILAPKNSVEALNRLDTQVELTAASISRISNPAEKKKAAEKYIAKLYEVSSVLSEKQKEFVTTPSSSSNAAPQSVITEPVTQPVTQSVAQQPIQDIPVKPTEQVSQNIIPTVTPTLISEITPTVSEQIDNTQETINQTIEKMTNLTTNNIVLPINNKDSNNKNEEEKDKLKEQKNSNSDKETNDGREKNKDRKNENQMK